MEFGFRVSGLFSTLLQKMRGRRSAAARKAIVGGALLSGVSMLSSGLATLHATWNNSFKGDDVRPFWGIR